MKLNGLIILPSQSYTMQYNREPCIPKHPHFTITGDMSP